MLHLFGKPNQIINAVIAIVFSQLMLISLVQASVVDEWRDGLGTTPNSVHSFLYEVTFLNIDVAIIEYQLDAETAEAINDIYSKGEMTEARQNQVGEILFASQALAFAMDLQRDASCNRLLKGMLGNLQRAKESEILSASEYELVNKGLPALLAPHEERGVFEGDILMYRVQPDGVRVILQGFDGELLVDSVEEGAAWAKGIKAIFLGKDSKLRQRLVEAVWDRK